MSIRHKCHQLFDHDAHAGLAGTSEAAKVLISGQSESASHIPLPVVTGTDGHDYSPLQAMGHVIGMRPQTVDATVSAVRSTRSRAVQTAQSLQSSMVEAASALRGMQCVPMTLHPCCLSSA